MGSTRAPLAYVRELDAPAFARVQRGLVPAAMEDKWFVFYEAPWLYLHRSWTGFSVYAVKLREVGDGAVVDEAWVSRASGAYVEADARYDAKLLAFLVDRLLLGLTAAFPVRDDVPTAQASLVAHHIVGYARSNDEE